MAIIPRHGNNSERVLDQGFFNRPPVALAKALLGKVIRHRVPAPGDQSRWLAARIIETEAYDIREKGSHASLGYTTKRAGLFMPPGTIYMYYARGKDSLNFSARGRGNGVLIKSGVPWIDDISPGDNIELMHQMNPGTRGPRAAGALCSGQTLLARSLGLRVSDWDQRSMDPGRLYVAEVGHQVTRIIICPRLGIPPGRDEHLPYRFIDHGAAAQCTSNPLTRRSWVEGKDYRITRVRG
ncbi:MAG: DNA-3-methyladenine glycosylase [Proteobacteria bacterium]|jgi:DNA-3-methyladenine glycosylase|nr:DNA-3-methyladenine glycosylase [Pseudomonadota bacterium]MDA1298489.1 DNA-3-methyladenine glycosylase [Pseudomonadota bacterium]